MGDVFEIPLFALWMNDLSSSIASGVVAVALMAAAEGSVVGRFRQINEERRQVSPQDRLSPNALGRAAGRELSPPAAPSA